MAHHRHWGQEESSQEYPEESNIFAAGVSEYMEQRQAEEQQAEQSQDEKDSGEEQSHEDSREMALKSETKNQQYP